MKEHIVKYCADGPVPTPSLLGQVGTALTAWKNFGFYNENILPSPPALPSDFITLETTSGNTNIRVLLPIGTSRHGVISHIRT